MIDLSEMRVPQHLVRAAMSAAGNVVHYGDPKVFPTAINGRTYAIEPVPVYKSLDGASQETALVVKKTGEPNGVLSWVDLADDDHRWATSLELQDFYVDDLQALSSSFLTSKMRIYYGDVATVRAALASLRDPLVHRKVSIRVIQDNFLDARMDAGGRLTVSSALVRVLSPEHLRAICGHEVGHFLRRDPGLAKLINASLEQGDFGEARRLAALSRRNEFGADALAPYLLGHASDLTDALRVMAVYNGADSRLTLSGFSTHPSHRHRARALATGAVPPQQRQHTVPKTL